MAQRGIREHEGKKILFDGLARHIPAFKGRSGKLVLVKPGTKPKDLLKANPWLGSSTSVIEKQLRIFPATSGFSQASLCPSVPYLWRISMFPASGAWTSAHINRNAHRETVRFVPGRLSRRLSAIG